MTAKRVKLFFLISLKYFQRKKAIFIIGVISFLAVLFLLSKINFFSSKPYLTLGFVGTYQEHDIPQEVTKLLSKGLVFSDSDGRIKSDLVESWDANSSATEFTFKLKQGLKWIDGTNLSAHDLGVSLAETETNVIDDLTIKFKLKQSYSPFPSFLTKPLFKKGTLLGVGPYEIKKIDKSIIFITKLSLVSPDENLPDLFVRFYQNEGVGTSGFNLGEVDAIFGLSNESLNFSNPQVKIKQKTDFSKIVAVLYSTKDVVLSNRSLRQALSFASPKIEEEEIADNPFSNLSWAYDKNSKKYLEKPDEAQSALSRAKSNIDKEKIKEAITLTTTPNLEEAGKAVTHAWEKLGFKINLRVESGIPQNFQALLITQSIPSDPDQYFLWHSTQGKTNLTQYASVRVDKDLEDGRTTIKEEERKKSYFDFQKTLLEDAPATFLYYPKYNIVYLKKAENLLNKILDL